jgi:hypothetical protein
MDCLHGIPRCNQQDAKNQHSLYQNHVSSQLTHLITHTLASIWQVNRRNGLALAPKFGFGVAQALEALPGGEQGELPLLVDRVGGGVLMEAAERAIAFHAAGDKGKISLSELRGVIEGL